MISEQRNKRAVILFMCCTLGLLLVGFYNLLIAPIPEKLRIQRAVEADEERPPLPLSNPRLQQDELGARDIRRKWLGLKPKYDEIMSEYQKLPRFKPPRNNHLTEEQMLAAYDIYMEGVRAVRRFQVEDLGERPGLFKAMATYVYIPALTELVRKQGLVKHRMTEEELFWVVHRIMEAALFACNRQWETGRGTPEERERLNNLRHAMARIVGLYEERTPEEGGTLTFPERLDSSKVPRANVALFLKLHEQVRWTGVRFYGMSFDEDYIMQAAQSLPE